MALDAIPDATGLNNQPLDALSDTSAMMPLDMISEASAMNNNNIPLDALSDTSNQYASVSAFKQLRSKQTTTNTKKPNHIVDDYSSMNSSVALGTGARGTVASGKKQVIDDLTSYDGSRMGLDELSSVD